MNHKHLESFRSEIEKELEVAKSKIVQKKSGEDVPDFDIRGKLYMI